MLNQFEKELLNILQTGLPVTPQPYQDLAQRLHSDENTVIEALRRLKAGGYIRRMGAFFDSGRLGYVSSLVALKVSAAALPEVAAAINRYPGVTHNYERESELNLWFTICCPSCEELAGSIEKIGRLTGVEKLINLPATQKFKVSVEFNLT